MILRLGRHVRHHFVGYLALFFALGGTAAAATIAANSVGSRQLKANAVTSSKVKNRSLTSSDFRSGTLKAGPKGDTGAAGPAGPAGASGSAATRSCPQFTTALMGACIETSVRGVAAYGPAAQACNAVGRRLATTAELLVGRDAPNVDLNTAEVASELLDITSGSAPQAYVTVTEAGGLQNAPLNVASPFRCVQPL